MFLLQAFIRQFYSTVTKSNRELVENYARPVLNA